MRRRSERNYALLALVVAVLAGALVLSGCSSSSSNNGSGGGGGQFAGSYSGTYAGNESGTWTATVTSSGAMTMDVVSPSVGHLTGTGGINSLGNMAVNTSGTGPNGQVIMYWTGLFATAGGVTTGDGTWTSTVGFGGPWTGQKS
jgi:uncharacterized protein YceK